MRRRIYYNTTSKSRESRNPNTKPKPETPNQPLGTTTSNNHSNPIHNGIFTQTRSIEATPREYTSLSTEHTIIIVGAIAITIRHLTLLSTRDDVLPTKYPKDTNSLSEEEGSPKDEYIAMSTAESEYIEIAKIVLATSSHRPRHLTT